MYTKILHSDVLFSCKISFERILLLKFENQYIRAGVSEVSVKGHIVSILDLRVIWSLLQ